VGHYGRRLVLLNLLISPHKFSKQDTELDSTIQFDPGFTATSILHPATYVNKVLVASSQGALQLWNIRSQCVIVDLQIDLQI